MKKSIKERKLARKIADLVLRQGPEGEKELPAILEFVLKDRNPTEKRRFLQLLQTTFAREIHRDTLTVEFSSALDEAVLQSIKEHFQKNHDRPLRMGTRENPDLIGGLRIQHGDSVFDASIAGKLEALASRVH